MLDNLIYVNETPWGKLGTTINTKPVNGKDIIEKCHLDWKVDSKPMYTDNLGIIPGYHAVFIPNTFDHKQDKLLGVVKLPTPKLVQNKDMFTALDTLLGEELDFDCAGVYKDGKTVFGVFKVHGAREKVLDDSVDNYIICMNDHLKPDGKIGIIHTPVRVICTNMLNNLIGQTRVYYRIPVTNDISINRDLAQTVYNSCLDSITRSNTKAKELVNIKLTRENMEEILDNLFPYEMTNTGDILPTRANDKVTIKRDTFISDCLEADNLSNYRGTAYQVYNALIDYTQHYFTKADSAYDLDKRMTRIPNFGDNYLEDKTKNLLKMVTKFAA